MSAFVAASCERPVVVVFGSTAVGKSKLGVRLAAKYGGEIISADSMQIYKGLDILTNKIKPEEMDGIPHHLIGFLEPGTEYTVVQFRNHCLKIINDVFSRGKLPILVGGTNYYIEAILWNVLVDAKRISEEETTESRRRTLGIDLSDSALESMATDEAFENLMRVDPAMAGQLHHNDRRKILRSLQVYWQTGKSHSSLLKEQRSQPGGSSLGGPLRFQRALIFWLHSDQSVLDSRIETRMDQMLRDGLVDELQSFHDQYTASKLEQGVEPDYTRGVYQSIGLKNFHGYLSMSPDMKSSEEGKAEFWKAVEEMKIYTRRYARKQKKWVLNRFLRNPERERLRFFGLNASDLDKWDNQVEARAYEVLTPFLAGKPIPFQTLKIDDVQESVEPENYPGENAEKLRNKDKHHCEVCGRIFVGSIAWAAHLSSRKHAKVAKAKKKREFELQEKPCDSRTSEAVGS